MTTGEKREAILQAALTLFAEHGFHNAPMSLLAREAGSVLELFISILRTKMI